MTMRQVVSAPPTIDVTAFAREIAKGKAVVADPSRRLCERHGYQTLYEVPLALQKELRLELIRGHAAALAAGADVVCDHSVFTWLADWMRWIWGATPTREWDQVLEVARPAVQASEVIHHVAQGPRAAYDGYRWLDARNAAQVEALTRQLYRELGCEARVKEARLT